MTEREPVTNYEKKRIWRDGDPNGELDPDKGGSTGKTVRHSAYAAVSSAVDQVYKAADLGMPRDESTDDFDELDELGVRDAIRFNLVMSNVRTLKRALTKWIEQEVKS